MRTLKKLTAEEKDTYKWGDYGIVENGKTLFQGTHEGCMDWLSAGN